MPDSRRVRPRAVPPLGGDLAFRLLVDSVTDYAIFLLDPSGIVQTWNRGAERIKGYRADEIIGQHFSAFYTPQDQATNRPMRLLAEAARLGRVEDEGWRVRNDGSRFWADVILSALRGPDGEPYAFAKVTRDLTERRAAEERERELLIEQQARAAAEEALRARDRFLSIASHELKTPVATLQLATEALMRARGAGKLDDERLDASLMRMLNSTRRLGTLVSELLNVSRLESDSAEKLVLVPTDLVSLVREVVARFHDAGETRVRFEAAPRLMVMADATRLDQVFTNLIDNALKYSDRPAEVLVSLRRSPEGVTVSVTDSGIGLDIGKDRIFSAFGRGRNADHLPGIGLGLFISRRIVELHGGRITVARRRGATGSTATVVLPDRVGEA